MQLFFFFFYFKTRQLSPYQPFTFSLTDTHCLCPHSFVYSFMPFIFLDIYSFISCLLKNDFSIFIPSFINQQVEWTKITTESKGIYWVAYINKRHSGCRDEPGSIWFPAEPLASLGGMIVIHLPPIVRAGIKDPCLLHSALHYSPLRPQNRVTPALAMLTARACICTRTSFFREWTSLPFLPSLIPIQLWSDTVLDAEWGLEKGLYFHTVLSYLLTEGWGRTRFLG